MPAEVARDRAAVRGVHLAAFGDHGPAVAALVDALRSAGPARQVLSLVAEDAGAVVGHVLFSPGLLDAPQRLVDVQVLSPLAVPVAFLEGPPAYCARLGFRPGRELEFRRPSLRIPEEAFQAVRLPAWQPWMTGTLVYAPTFWEQDAVGLRASHG